MRYDTPILFQLDGAAVYDAATGNYTDAAATETTRYAAVMDTKAEMVQLVYGALKQGSLTVQLQSHYDAPLDRMIVRGRPYKVDYARRLRHKHVFIVSEVPS